MSGEFGLAFNYDSAKDKDFASNVYGSADLLGSTNAINGREVIKDTSGKLKELPLEKFSQGDHTVKLKDGREFIVHVPENDGKTQLPVMFVFPGSAHGNFNIKDFVPESGINSYADSSEKFVAVYPLPKEHLIGTGSDKLAYAWNVLDPKGGVLIDSRDSKNAGYDDLEYVKSIVAILPQVANVDQSHKDWAAIGFSQGGLFLNYLASNVPNLFPTMGLVGTAIQTNYKYDVKAGNAQNVAIVNLRADEATLPFKSNESSRYRYESILHFILPKQRFQKLSDLAAINNLKSDPQKQISFYENRLGAHSTETINFNTPLNNSVKDKETIHKSTEPRSLRQLAVIDLPLAQHSYPEADPSGARTNAAPKYTEFQTNRQIVDLWMNYNKKIATKIDN